MPDLDDSQPDWDARYAAETTPWDLGRPVPLLVEALDEGTIPRGPGRAFVPGAGRGYDADELSRANWQVTAVDLSATAAAYAAEHFPKVAYGVGDALDPDTVARFTGGQVDLLFDHTFFCALPPASRPRMNDLADAVVRPGGLLASVVFPIGRPDAEGGPPFGYSPEDLDAVIPGFEQIHLGPETSVLDRPWPHRLAIWRREI